jgi:hypothetical protein
MVRIVCQDCDASFETPGDYAAHRESEHTLPPRQPFGHR